MLGEEQNESGETTQIKVIRFKSQHYNLRVRFPLMDWIAGERQCFFQ